MDFGWTDDQVELYARIKRQVREHIAPLTSARHVDAHITREEWRACGDAGILGLSVPKELGGQGLGWVSTARAMEAFGYESEDMGLPFSAAAHLFAVAMPIAEFAGEELAHDLLPRMCAGDMVGANAITESESGSDVYALRMRALKDGEDYILNGTKTFISNAPMADVFVVYATVNPKHGFLGISAFVVDGTSAGLRRDPPFYKTGLKSVPASVVHFEDCRVPARRRLGRDGQGGSIFTRSMLWERACLIAGFLGVMERQIERAIEHVKRRHQFNAPLASFQAVSHGIVDMKRELEAARLLLYRGCWLAERGLPATVEISMAKLAVAESAMKIGTEGTQLLGGAGIQDMLGMERLARDALAASIASGTSNMQREIIAKSLGI